MITRFKLYEKNEPKFKVGDYVYVIYDKDKKYIHKDKKYKITAIKHLDGENKDNLEDYTYSYQYWLEGIPEFRYDEDRFISELEYNTKKYNL